MTQLTPDQRRTRARVETLIRLMSPALNLVLATGERISRLVEPVDHEYYPPPPVAVAGVLWFLCRATKYRRPQVPPIAMVLAIAGPIAFGIIGAIGPFVIKHFAAEFATGLNHTNKHAKDLVGSGSAKTLGLVTPIAGLLF